MDCKRFRLTVIGVLSVLLTASGQNYVNVALGKTYSQSSIHTSIQGPSSNAANGNTDGEYTATNCIHTVTNDPNDWWQVDLGGMYPLYNFMVWGRDQYASRLYPFAITVDSRACASVVNGSSLSVEVTCPSIMYGQVVRITRTNNTEMLNLCELQVLVCQAGYYGTTCDTPCHTIRCLNNQCDRVTGWCTQCPGNFQGDTCSECVGGYYGPSCGRECLVNHTKCSDNQCDRTTGLCAACDGNYEGYDCSCNLRYHHGVA